MVRSGWFARALSSERRGPLLESIIGDQSHRGLDAREPLVRPHARVPVPGSRKRLPRRATLRRPDRRRIQSRCERQERQGFPDHLRHAERVLHAGGRSRRRLCGDQRAAVRQPDGAGASCGDQCRLRDQLCIDTRPGIQRPELFGAARNRSLSDHGHLYAGRLADSLGPGSRLCSVRSVVQFGADRDHAEPRVCERRHVPGSHERCHAQLHLAEHLWTADKAQPRLVDLRIFATSQDASRLYRHGQRLRVALRRVHGFHRSRGGRHAAALHFPGTVMGIDGQQPASELRCRARRAAHSRCVLRAVQKPGVESNAADPDVR